MPVFVVLCFVMYSGQIHSWTIMIKISLASFVIHEKNTISVGKSCKHLEFLFFTSKDILIWSIILAFYLSTEAPCNLFVFSFPRIFLSLSISPSFHFNVPMSTASWKKKTKQNVYSWLCLRPLVFKKVLFLSSTPPSTSFPQGSSLEGPGNLWKVQGYLPLLLLLVLFSTLPGDPTLLCLLSFSFCHL